jgi:cytochrome c556
MRALRLLHFGSWLVLAILTACAPAQRVSPTPVLTLMVDVVTPATNTLWSAQQPLSEAEWQELAAAADLTIRAFEQIRTGGPGPNDAAWAADPRWQSHSDAVISAARKARSAIDHRDSDALFEANAELHRPCEACHIDFHPNLGPEDS